MLILRALLLCLLCTGAARAETLRDWVNALGEADAAEKRELLAKIAASGNEKTDAVFDAVSRGALYRDRRSNAVVLAERDGSSYQLRDVLSGEDLGTAGRRDVRRVAIDNSLRAELQSLQAIARLSSESVEQRADAIAAVLAAPTDAALKALAAREPLESDAALQDQIAIGLALQALSRGDAQNIMTALKTLRGRVDPTVRAALLALESRQELPQTVRDEASRLLLLAENRLLWLSRLESLFFGLSLGSVLLLSAVGLAITFGVMGVINMAHGELIMLGAYTTWVLQQWLPGQPGVALLLAIPFAFLVSAIVGLIIERGVIRFLYGRPLETLLATFGISLILQQAVRSIFSPLNRSVLTPEWLAGSWEITAGLSLTYNRMAILLFSLLVFAGLLTLMRYTRLGLQVRAVAQNRAMARALGVRSSRVDALTFALGSGVAGVAGVALSQLTNVGPNLGQSYIIDSFLVVVFGGVGNLWGTLVAAFSLGVANKVIEPLAGAVLAKIVLLVFLILFLQRRPQGLFPGTGREDSH
ncbi:urea ABC transporter permease subunit UrtB [Congregibacter litoralis]|uniref:Amino acid/amide ABC transporter membrane protein 1, HAAT family n=1 Tax=Congregibacter litoralis KT71 TaxID=314285 RepID=A4AAN2_9GAMM|nr:urea ABC transporter permease subunit UrtB [Congregibacter litoralis]EAQ97109.1 amino acid/amide ABC transporter membrane protein 1, HAAT family [Congregibacter litoralis KT71]